MSLPPGLHTQIANLFVSPRVREVMGDRPILDHNDGDIAEIAWAVFDGLSDLTIDERALLIQVALFALVENVLDDWDSEIGGA